MHLRQSGQSELVVSAASPSVCSGVSDLVVDIVAGFADGEKLLHSHLDTYEELIPHVFFSDVSGFVLECHAEAVRQGALASVSRALESALATASSVEDGGEWKLYLENLLFVSWFEAIDVEPAILATFLAESGPLVKGQHAAYVKATELYWRIHSDPSMTREKAAQVILQADRDADADRVPHESSDEPPVN